jgi:hypothetical protein
MQKDCFIVNQSIDIFIMLVDGKSITFNGLENAEYFFNLYHGLGYKCQLTYSDEATKEHHVRTGFIVGWVQHK